MRVISGRLKGRPLLAPKGHSIRPTSDQAKETLFNMLGPYVHQATMLDLFAGTGNVGIEALSRGAERVVFVEKAPKHLYILKRNLSVCDLESESGSSQRSIVYHGDANKIITRLHKNHWCFDLAFLDPPYRQTNLLCDILCKVLDLSLIKQNGLIVIEHATAFTPPAEPGHSFSLTKQRRIGDTTLSFYRS